MHSSRLDFSSLHTQHGCRVVSLVGHGHLLAEIASSAHLGLGGGLGGLGRYSGWCAGAEGR